MITLGVVCWGDEGVTSLTSPRGWWGGQAGREGGSTEAFVGFHQLALLCSVPATKTQLFRYFIQDQDFNKAGGINE